jgi:hypothetical protein
MQLFKRSGRAFVFDLINDLKVPHDAQQVWDGFGHARIHRFGRDGKFFGVRKQVQQVCVFANGLNAVRERAVNPSVTGGFNAGWRQKY